MRRWSASLIAAAMIFSGSDYDGIPGDGDDDGVECVEYGASPAETGGAHGLHVAARILHTPTDGWLAPAHEPRATITLHPLREHVAIIGLSPASVVTPKLLSAALRYAFDHSVLKVVLRTIPADAVRARTIAEQCGWQVWRTHQNATYASTELLCDLYRRAEADSADRRS